LLDKYTDLFFFTLFLRLVNDSNPKVRTKVTQVLCKLVRKTSNAKQLIETVFKMGAEEDNDASKREFMTSGKLQLIQIFAECKKLTKADIDRSVDFCAVIVSKQAASL